MQTALNRMGRIRLFPLLFQNGCSQGSRFLPQDRRIEGSGDENVANRSQVVITQTQSHARAYNDTYDKHMAFCNGGSSEVSVAVSKDKDYA